MRVRGDAPHDDLCPSNDGSPGPVDCDFCERLYSADARGYTRGWSAGHVEGQRDMLARCIAAVVAMPEPWPIAVPHALPKFNVLAALRALSQESGHQDTHQPQVDGTERRES